MAWWLEVGIGAGRGGGLEEFEDKMDSEFESVYNGRLS
jgi:hypothetical protein